MNRKQRKLSISIGLVATAALVSSADVANAEEGANADQSFESQEGDSSLDLVSLLDQIYTDVEVVTASRKAQNIKQAPAVMFVVTQREIQQRGYKDLKDVFRDLPGFDVSEEVTGEVRTLAIARGILGANKLMVLKDGKRLNAITGERLIIGNNMPLFNVQRIEIMYGPGSVLYGADAYAGVVNIVTRTYEDLRKEGKHGIANVSYGNNQRLDAAAMVGTKITDDITTDFSFRWFQTQGENMLGRPGFEDYASERYEQPTYDHEFYWRANIGDLKLTVLRENSKEPGGPSTLPLLFKYDENFVWHQIQNKAYIEHTKSGENWELVSTVGVEEYRLGTKTNFQYNDESPIPGVAGIGSQYKFGHNQAYWAEEQLFVDISTDYKLTLGVYGESVVAFAKGNNLSKRYDRSDLLDTITYPDDPAIDEEYRGKTISFGPMPYKGLGTYAEFVAHFGPKVTANAGLRVDYNTDYKFVATPRLGVIVAPSKLTTLKALYGEAYIRPSRYLAFEHWSAGAFGYQPNPDLKPERLRSFQLSAEHRIDAFRVTASAYYNLIRDLIRPESASAWNRNVNAGEPKTFGGDVRLDYIYKTLHAYASYSYLHAEQDNGDPMNKVAPHKLTVGFDLEYDKFSLSPRFRWSDKIPVLDAQDDGSIGVVREGGHQIVDVAATYSDVGNVDGLDVYVSGRNVLNSEYIAAGSFGEGPEGWLNRVAPQPKVTVEAGVRMDF